MREGRIDRQVMWCEHTEITDTLADLVGIPTLYKEPAQSLAAYVGLDAQGIAAFPRFLNCRLA